MARRARSNFGRRTSRPNRGWAGLSASTFTALAASTSVLVATFVPSNPGIDETILRTVGLLAVTADQAGANEDQVGAFGLIRVTEAAVAIGITAIPTPITEQADDGWMVYQAFAGQGDNSIGAVNVQRYVIDSKAKRTLAGEGEAFAVVVQNASASFGIQFAINIRVLGQVRGTA